VTISRFLFFLFDLSLSNRNYEKEFIILMVNIFPTITARREYYARKTIDKPFQKYFELDQYKSAGGIVTESANTARKCGLSRSDTTNLETF
jgi:hypothetical protein